jgi:predicted RNase H-like HicB family nuclease
MKIKVVMEPQEEGGFTVYVPSLPGCISEGDDKETTLRNIRDAIALYPEMDESELRTQGTRRSSNSRRNVSFGEAAYSLGQGLCKGIEQEQVSGRETGRQSYQT